MGAAELKARREKAAPIPSISGKGRSYTPPYPLNERKNTPIGAFGFDLHFTSNEPKVPWPLGFEPFQ